MGSFFLYTFFSLTMVYNNNIEQNFVCVFFMGWFFLLSFNLFFKSILLFIFCFFYIYTFHIIFWCFFFISLLSCLSSFFSIFLHIFSFRLTFQKYRSHNNISSLQMDMILVWFFVIYLFIFFFVSIFACFFF